MSKHSLQYQTPEPQRNSLRFGGAAAGATIGVAFAVPMIIVAVMSGGAGHGDYAAARALFPVPMLLTLITDGSIAVPSIVLVLTQFPIYGAIIGWCATARKAALVTAIVTISVSHLAAVAACFSGIVPNFS